MAGEFDQLLAEADAEIVSVLGESAEYTPLGGLTKAINVVIEKGVQPFSEDRLNTSINDQRTVATIQAADVPAVQKGDTIDVGDVRYTAVHVLKSDGSIHEVIVK